MNAFHINRLLRFTRLAASQGVDFGLAHNVIPIALWQGSGKNLVTVGGTLTLDGKPVGGVAISADQYVLSTPTSAGGAFEFLLDQTDLVRRVLKVVDVSGAQIDGQPISADQQSRLRDAQTAVNVAFVMTLDQQPDLRKGDTNVRLSGRLTFGDNATPVPPVALWDYIIQGVIRDSQGNPVANALASIVGEGGESSALSSPTGETGQYTLRFFPEQGNQFDVRVGYGQTLYTSDNVVSFTAGKSAEMDLVLPASGDMLMGTGPGGRLEPKELDGAEYIGILTGLAAGDAPINESLTWPDKQGAFTIAIPTVDFDGPVSFYQAQLRFFSATEQSPGGAVAANAAPTTLSTAIPRDLHPLSVAAS